MVPDQLQPTFFELGEESLDNLETVLSERFERLMQNSKSNAFNSKGLKQHIEGAGHKPHCQTLRKALEEIAVSNMYSILTTGIRKVLSRFEQRI